MMPLHIWPTGHRLTTTGLQSFIHLVNFSCLQVIRTEISVVKVYADVKCIQYGVVLVLSNHPECIEDTILKLKKSKTQATSCCTQLLGRILCHITPQRYQNNYGESCFLFYLHFCFIFIFLFLLFFQCFIFVSPF